MKSFKFILINDDFTQTSLFILAISYEQAVSIMEINNIVAKYEGEVKLQAA